MGGGGFPDLPTVGKNTLFGQIFNYTPIGAAYGAAARTINDPLGAKNLASNQKTAMNTLLGQQAAQAAQAAKLMREKPKQIAPDNFLATKASQLANLRLGLASTITGMPGVPPATLSSPSLSPSGGKTKLGL